MLANHVEISRGTRASHGTPLLCVADDEFGALQGFFQQDSIPGKKLLGKAFGFQLSEVGNFGNMLLFAVL